MAVRKRLYHPDEVRQKIKTSQLVNRLTSHVLDDLVLTPSQVTAAVALIRKTMPDLSNIENLHVGDKERPVYLLPVDAEL